MFFDSQSDGSHWLTFYDSPGTTISVKNHLHSSIEEKKITYWMSWGSCQVLHENTSQTRVGKFTGAWEMESQCEWEWDRGVIERLVWGLEESRDQRPGLITPGVTHWSCDPSFPPSLGLHSVLSSQHLVSLQAGVVLNTESFRRCGLWAS